jgi:hypothetical protein
MPEKNYQEMLNAVFGRDEDTRLQKGSADIYYLWRWILPRLLLGQSIDEAREYVKLQINSFEPSPRIDVALRDWMQLSALFEIFDESSEKFVRKAENYLSLQTDLDKENHQIVESALAAAVYLGNERAAAKWRESALRLPLEIGAEYVVFELLFLTDSEIVKDLDLEKSANTTARVIYKVLMGAPFYSSAPHILALALIARIRDKRLSALLKGRIKELDKMTHDKNGKPLINFGKLKKAVVKENGETVLNLTLTARGTGEIDISCCDVSALTYELPPFLVELAEKEVLTPDTKIVAELVLKEKVSISDKETEILRKRFNLALEITKNQVDFPIAGNDLIIKKSGKTKG